MTLLVLRDWQRGWKQIPVGMKAAEKHGVGRCLLSICFEFHCISQA